MDEAAEEEEAPEIDCGLSQEQLQDLVVAAAPANEAETMFLCNVLDEAGIPAVSEGDRLSAVTGNLGAGTRIFVPRLLVEKAKALIAESLAGAKKRGVEQAFEPENVQETIDGAKRLTLMREMADLRDKDAESRKDILAHHIVDWQLANMPAVEIARHLAAAGLSLEEANALVKESVQKYREEITGAANAKVVVGTILAAAGALGLLLRAMVQYGDRSLVFHPGIHLILLFAGAVFIIIGISTKPRESLLPPDSNDQNPKA